MRINKFVALATGRSRRAADVLVADGRVEIDGQTATPSTTIDTNAVVTLDGKPIQAPTTLQTILFNKPAGYIVSRDGQGNPTIYDLLPPELHHLKPVGRLDKDSSGLLLLTNDGALAQQLTHPTYQKTKIYEVAIDKPLQPLHRQMISDFGLQLEDGPSKLQLERLHDGNEHAWRITMHEGRNRQIRRTFESLGYHIKTLHRTHFGRYDLRDLSSGHWALVKP
jgi:23S rRNA pseudouridine2605 synthase